MDLIELVARPIRADAPCGDDIKYDADYEELQAEIDKLSIPSSSGGGIDWNHVIQMATTILTERSKNLLVAAYLAAALLETRKIDGFIESLDLLQKLSETFWDDMFPSKKRMRGRINAFEWWLNRTDGYFTSNSITPQKAEKIEAAKSILQSLDQAVSGKIENGPNIIRLKEHIDRWPQLPEPKQAASVTDPQAISPKPSENTSVEASPSSISTGTQLIAFDPKTPQEADKALSAVLKQLIKIADHLLEHEPSNPLTYQLMRIGSWVHIDKLPLSENNQTQLPPPAQSVRGNIESHLQSRDFSKALIASESKIREHLFWLDLCRYTSEALNQMGGQFQSAGNAVNLTTAMFIKKLPGVEKLSFSDGTPFADPQTKAWLKTILQDMGGNDPQGFGAMADSGIDSALSSAMTEGMRLFKDRKLVEALDLFQKPLAGSLSGRTRFGWRIALARFLMSIGKIELAKPHFDELLRQMDVYNLEDWEPDLAIQALGVVYEGLETAGDSQDRAKIIFDRIGRISSTAALACLKA